MCQQVAAPFFVPTIKHGPRRFRAIQNLISRRLVGTCCRGQRRRRQQPLVASAADLDLELDLGSAWLGAKVNPLAERCAEQIRETRFELARCSFTQLAK